MSEENVEIVRRAIEAWNQRDLPTMRALWRSDAEVDWSRSVGPLQGVYQGGGLKTVSSEFWSTFEEVELETHGFRQVGSNVVVPNIAHMRGRESTFVYTVENGQITRLRMFQEQAEALEAVGLRE